MMSLLMFTLKHPAILYLGFQMQKPRYQNTNTIPHLFIHTPLSLLRYHKLLRDLPLRTDGNYWKL